MRKQSINSRGYDTHATTLKLSLNFGKLEKITDKWGFLRQVYMENIADITQEASQDVKRWAQVYYLDWPSLFSPIERTAWDSIRNLGHVVLYPQFPLFNYFIDFANPYLRIGLELDGQNYHDPVKDKERDQMLAEYGWKIFRVTGSEAQIKYINIIEIEDSDIEGFEKQEKIEHWFLNTCDGIINAIKYWYFLNEDEKKDNYSFYLNPNDPFSEKVNIKKLAEKTLKKHQLANFPL
jgi:very-short-patch-repair endonuclease